MGQHKDVLVVEDDREINELVGAYVQIAGFEYRSALDGASALQQARQHHPSLIVLDLMLPDTDGFAVCRRIRRESDVPVIMVSARTDSHDVVAGLEAGADDYVTKPLVAKELSARIRALLRRTEPLNGGPRSIAAGDLEIHVDEGFVLRDDKPLALTRTEFRLLAELARADGKVCSREYLLERVWGYGYFGDSRIVDVHIRRLRGKVERDPGNPRLVVTARGLGYRLVR